MLTWTIWTSFLGAALVMSLPENQKTLIRWSSLLISLIGLGIGLYFVYMLGRIVYALIGFVGKSSKFIAYPMKSSRKNKEEKTRKQMEKLVRKKERKR